MKAKIRIAGKPAKLLVDTGAYSSFLTQAAVWYHGIRGSDKVLEDFVVYEDSAPLERAFDTVEFESPDAPSMPRSIEVISSPISAANIAGALAPFDLVEKNGTVVIDIRKSTIHFNPKVLPKLPGLLLSTHVRRCSEQDPDDRRFSVRATIDGHTGWLLVDTGATHTAILNGQAFNALIKTGKDAPHWKKDVLGAHKMLASIDVGERRLDIGQWSGALALIAIENTQFPGDCEIDGVLGMDVLADCTIVWKAGDEKLACTKHLKRPQQLSGRESKKKAVSPLSSVALKLAETCGATRDDVNMASPFPVQYLSYGQAFNAMSKGVRVLSEKLLQQCYDEGFVKARPAAKLVRKGDEVTMIVGVHRGEKHRIGSIRIIEVFPHGEHVLPATKVRELISTQLGSVVSLPQLKIDSDRLHSHYQKWARPYQQFVETLYLHNDEIVVDLEFRICLASGKQIDDAFIALCRGKAQ